ncbi:MAG: carbohydrate ABC transporter permease [Eubacteriales bacterium]|nr:carbohydrate ABC transporter permease [Eubacteriales bacterium]
MKEKLRISRVLIQLLLVIWSLVQLYPVIVMFMASLKTDSQITLDLFGLPKPIDLQNFPEVWFGKDIGLTLGTPVLNSVVITALTLLLLCFGAALCGYALSRFRFPGNKVVYYLLVSLIAIPMQALILPIYLFAKDLGALNSIWFVIPMLAAFQIPFSVIIMKTNFESLPHVVEEAAYIDGCSKFKTFWHIVMPMSRGSIATIIIVNLVSIWGEFMFSSTILMLPNVRTLPTAVSLFTTNMYNSTLGPLFAGLSIASFPLIIVYFIFQKQIVKGMAVGSVK